MVLDAGQAIHDGSGGRGDNRLTRSKGQDSVGEGERVGVAGKPGEAETGQLGGQVRFKSPQRGRRHRWLGGLCRARGPLRL